MKTASAQNFFDRILRHRYGFTLCVFLTAAAATGLVCVLFMWFFEQVLAHRLDFGRIGFWCWVTTPLLFLLSVELIRRFAPHADGAGIPQTIFVGKHFTDDNAKRLSWTKFPFNLRCAVIGMAAFLSGAIQAPITAFVIIFEMTGQHQMLLPIMLASLLAFMVARVFGAKHLYQTLAAYYQPALDMR